MLFPLETLIPTAFIGHLPINRFAIDKGHLFSIADSICLLTRMLRYLRWLYLHKPNTANERLAD